ncbi:MAG TPA: DUF6518 family protein [Solirubrobacteraceae bacterium]|jgi:hypothetical protein
MRRVVLAALLAIPLGVLVGAASQEADAVVRHGKWIAALGVPLLAVCWGAGAVAGRAGAGAVAGAVTMTVATATYYALHFHHFGGSLRGAPIVVGWSAASLASGGVFGLAGGAWRAAARVPVRVAAVALLAGALAGEALLLAREWPERVGPLLYAELVAAAALPFLLVRPLRALPAALVLTAVAALVLGAAEHEVRETMRLAGWRGL